MSWFKTVDVVYIDVGDEYWRQFSTALIYRGGLIMLAILVAMGTKYACNLDHVGDQICLQSQSRWGPYMPAILITIGTKYACNLGSKGDQICLQFQFRKGPYMPAIVSVGDHICLQFRFFKYLFDPRRSLSRCFKNFRDCRHIWSPTDTIAGIYGPYRN